MKIKLVTPDPRRAAAWSVALAAAEAGLQVTGRCETLEAIGTLVNGHRPDLVIAELADAGDLPALEALGTRHPGLDLILVGANLSANLLMAAMRCGVREVVPAPDDSAALVQAVLRIAKKRDGAAVPVPPRHGEVIAFVSCKGGSGATFVAANLAHILAGAEDRRVALIDMNLQFGDASLFISSEPPVSNVADVARNIQRLDRELLESAMTRVGANLWVLPAPDDPVHAADVTPEHVQAIVQQARAAFDLVLIDAGRSLTGVTLQALDQSDRVYAVLQLTLPFIRDGKRLAQVFRSLDYPARKIHWVVNRYQKDSQITLDDVKRTLGIAELVTLPNQYDVVAASVNQGVAVDRIAPNSTITRALRGFADQIAPRAAKLRSGGWLTGLFKGGAQARATP